MLFQSVFYHGRFDLEKPGNCCDWLHSESWEDELIKTLQLFHADAPEQSKEKDENGNTLLHLVLFNRKAGFNTKNPLYSKKLIKYLLRLLPGSVAIRNNAGHLPLHVALEYAHPAYKLLVSASPCWAFEAKCPTRRVYPFQLPIAFGVKRVRNLGGGKVSKHDETYLTEMSFHVLRRAPAIIASTCSLKGRENNAAWFDSDLYKEIQQKELQRAKLAGEIVVLRAKLEVMKKDGEVPEKSGKRKRDEGWV